MRMRRFVITAAIASFVVSFDAPASAQVTGLVGTIASAINAVFPSVGTLFGKLFGNGNPDPKPSQTSAKTAAQTASASAAQGAMKNVTSELSTIASFFSNCTQAEAPVATMRGRIAGQTSISDALAMSLNHDWATATNYVTALTSMKTQVGQITNDSFVQTTLTNAINANNGDVTNIPNDIKNKDLNSLNADLADLDAKLTAVNALASIVVADISQGLQAAVTTAAGAGGSPKSPLSQNDTSNLKNILAKKFGH